MRTRLAPVIALLAAGLGVAWSQQTQDRLKEAIGSFGQGNYSHAVVLLRGIVLDPADTADKGEAYFWLTKSYLALDTLEDGERSLELFLSNYPNHLRFAEAFYEKGRLLYRQEDYENAIQVLQSFLERYPDSEFVPNAYFWTGESLYALGQLDDALLVFKKVVDAYPSSFKIEAARYRIALIEFKKRENELLKLLKWSHEESLRTIEGFQRRETTYEQAIAAYQKKLATYEQADLPKALDGLKQGLERKEAEAADLAAKLAQAKAEIEKLQAEAQARERALVQTTSSSPAAAAQTAEKESLRRLLGLKADALVLKAALLEWMLARVENR